MTSVTSGLIDHVHKDPPEIDRSFPERRDGGNRVERIKLGDCTTTAGTGVRVQRHHSLDWVESTGMEWPVGIGDQRGRRPWFGKIASQQLGLEPQILSPCKVLNDSCDREVRRWQRSRSGLLLIETRDL